MAPGLKVEPPMKPEAVCDGASALLPDDEEDEMPSCSPTAQKFLQRYLTVDGQPRRAAAMVIEELHVLNLLAEVSADTRHDALPDLRQELMPLHLAARAGDVRAVRYLLLSGFDPRETNRMGETVLQVAEAANLSGSNDAVIQLLKSLPMPLELLREQL
ncbi:unnamed protein product [Durusdinium trenchii]|uniref:Uncharacterized protein n=1 Tax=Durusdinium trenchii TaxID=1381693 RepID=A0ABP0Q8T8_9DINO